MRSLLDNTPAIERDDAMAATTTIATPAWLSAK